MLFIETLGKWEHVADFGVVIRTHLSSSSVNDAAASHGYEVPLEAHVMERVRLLEDWLVQEEKRRRAATPPPGSEEKKTWSAREDQVN